MYASLRRIFFFVVLSTTLLLSLRVVHVRAEEAADDAVADDYYNDDADDDNAEEAANDDQVAAYENYNNEYQGDGDYIKYWTEYAIFPKRCIVYNNKDVILFQVFENGYNHCTDTALGTYITSVPEFMQGYLAQKEQDTEDQGYEYEEPEVAQYAYCTPFEIENQMFYFQLGCADDTTEKLAVNIYEDNTCTKRSAVDGYDDSNIDVSAIQLTFKKCHACVNWFDQNDDQEVDDGFYENRMMNAPLCSTAWSYKEECGRKCQRTGMEKSDDGWQASDLVLLGVLTAFGLTMLGLIIHKRRKMSNKDTLLEQAALSAAGLQQPHVIGILVLIILVIAVFALLRMKNITWILLLMINTVLFVYLMKITIASSVPTGESIIGPDGTILRNDSDDDDASDASEEKNPNNGTYSLPTIT